MTTVLSGNPTGSDESNQDMAVKLGNPIIYNLPRPQSYGATATRTYTTTDILNGIIMDNGNGSSSHTANLPSATSLAAAMRLYSSRGITVGDTVECLIVNSGGSGTFTLAAGSGGTFDTNASQTIGQGASKWVIIWFSSGVVGSETYVVFS